MALQLTFDTEHGLSAPTAYARIHRFQGDKNEITFDVLIHADQAARDEGRPELGKRWYTLPYTDGSTIGSLYTYLKTLPEWAGATDV